MSKNFRSVADMNIQIKDLLNEKPSKRHPSFEQISSRRSNGRTKDILGTVSSVVNKEGFLDSFRKNLDLKKQNVMRRNATDRSLSQTSAGSRTQSSRRDRSLLQTTDITSKHLDIEKRRFTEIQKNSDLHQASLVLKYLSKAKESQPSKVASVLDSLERSRMLGYDYLDSSRLKFTNRYQ